MNLDNPVEMWWRHIMETTTKYMIAALDTTFDDSHLRISVKINDTLWVIIKIPLFAFQKTSKTEDSPWHVW